eukprot:scaffold3096_cov403-Prasinococcus_capsulatus_cf.AAC.1
MKFNSAPAHSSVHWTADVSSPSSPDAVSRSLPACGPPQLTARAVVAETEGGKESLRLVLTHLLLALRPLLAVPPLQYPPLWTKPRPPAALAAAPQDSRTAVLPQDPRAALLCRGQIHQGARGLMGGIATVVQSHDRLPALYRPNPMPLARSRGPTASDCACCLNSGRGLGLRHRLVRRRSPRLVVDRDRPRACATHDGQVEGPEGQQRKPVEGALHPAFVCGEASSSPCQAHSWWPKLAVSARGRGSLGQQTTVSASLEVDSLEALRREFKRQWGTKSPSDIETGTVTEADENDIGIEGTKAGPEKIRSRLVVRKNVSNHVVFAEHSTWLRCCDAAGRVYDLPRTFSTGRRSMARSVGAMSGLGLTYNAPWPPR